VGLHGTLATLALYGAALLDLALGVATLIVPARRRRPVWLAQLALIAGYTVLITIFLPDFWLHPYGPISKNLPVLAAIALLWALEPPRRAKQA
jgi:peptidoglycan/LPS O-acetylase OafA/YrhL